MTPAEFALVIVGIAFGTTVVLVGAGMALANWQARADKRHQALIDTKACKRSRRPGIRPRRSNRERRAVSSRRCIVRAPGRVWP